GTIMGELNIDESIGRTLFDVSGPLFGGVLQGHLRIVVTPQAWGFLASLALQVPSFIPIIGGLKLGEADAVGAFPRKAFTVTGIKDGVVTTSDTISLTANNPFKFTGLVNPPAGFDSNAVYYATPTGANTFTFSDTIGGTPDDLTADTDGSTSVTVGP